VVAACIQHRGRPGREPFMKELVAVMDNCAGVRRFGSASLDLAYVAAGRCDGYWERGLKPWDIAAGVVLVREAGGYVTDMDGKPDVLATCDVVAANDHLQSKLVSLLKKARTEG